LSNLSKAETVAKNLEFFALHGPKMRQTSAPQISGL
jgi:hypothetical protein